MHRSLLRWLRAAYRANPPELRERFAVDESPAVALRTAVRRLSRYWERKFRQAAPDLAEYFSRATAQRTDAAMRSILRRGGFSVRFQPGRAANDVLQATIAENVGLIRSIAQQHLGAVEGMVMRSVAQGRDLASLSQALEKQFHVTKRRAALISRDQNNKATAAITRARQLEVGIREAIWVHSGGGKTPRPSHVKAGRDGVRFDLTTGWYDPDEREWILPGQLINCRCVSRPLVPGFS